MFGVWFKKGFSQIDREEVKRFLYSFLFIVFRVISLLSGFLLLSLVSIVIYYLLEKLVFYKISWRDLPSLDLFIEGGQIIIIYFSSYYCSTILSKYLCKKAGLSYRDIKTFYKPTFEGRLHFLNVYFP